jgi:hypothetical protein
MAAAAGDTDMSEFLPRRSYAIAPSLLLPHSEDMYFDES